MLNFLKFFEEFDIINLNNVKAIGTPEEFFSTLKNGLTYSKEAFISTMYFGEDEQTKELFHLIKIRNQKKKKTIIFVDKERGMTDKIVEMIIKYDLIQNFYFVKMNFLNLPGRLPELISVFHSKIILFDEMAILTGANIDRNYFISRIDRYLIIKSHSLSIELIDSFFLPFLMNSIKQSAFNIIKISDVVRNEKRRPIDVIKLSQIKITEQSYQTKLLMYDEKLEYKVLESIVNAGFDEIYLSTAYLNFPKQYIKLLRNSNLKIFVSDPKTNKFNNYGMFCNTVTEIFKYSSLRTLYDLPNAKIYEFRKDGYTKHLKGIWAFSKSVSVSMVGSSNFNRRSFERDSELNFLLMTNDNQHVKILNDEVQFLLGNSTQRDINELRSRDYSVLIIIIYFLLNRYL